MALNFLNNGYFAGKVGIGTESPERLLSLYSDNTETTPRLLIEQDGTGDAVMAFSLTGGQGWSMGIDNSGGDAFMIHNSAGGVDSSSQFTILNSGNVGIGITDPVANLHVESTNDGMTNGINTNQLKLSYGASSIGAGSSLAFGVSSVEKFTGAKIVHERTASNSVGDLTFWTRETAGTSTDYDLTVERMRIDSAGNVGIGDTPSFKLDVNVTSSRARFKAITGNANIELSSIEGHDWLMQSLSDDSFAIYDEDAGTERMRIDSSGNVGIGTSSVGTYKLNVNGAIRIGVSGTIQPLLSRDSSTGGLIVSSVGNSGDFIFQGSGGSEKFRITDTGNVGIGATAPTAPLHFGKTVYGDPSSENFFRIKFNDVGGVMNDVGIGQPNASSIGWNITPSANGVFEWNAGTEGRVMNLTNAGVLTLDSYDSTNNTGTPTYLLGTDASGNVVKTNTVPGSGAGPYLPLSAGSSYPLTGDLYMPGFIFHVGDTDSYFGFGAPNVFDLVTGGSRKLYADNTAVYLYKSGSQKLRTTSTGVTVTGDIKIDSALLSNQNNTDVDTGTETVANVAIATYTAAFFDFVIKKGTNVRSGTVYACHDGTNVEFTETSTQDLGDTSDVTLSVDISGGNMRLLATVTSDDWSVKSLIRAI